MLMVSRYVVMHLFPKTFDGIVIGRIGRQEVQLDTALEAIEYAQGPLGFVDDVIVENQMNPARSAVTGCEPLQQADEEFGVFSQAMCVYDAAGSAIERARDVVLDVLARGEHQRLPAPLDVRQSDARVQVDVGLIHIKDFFRATGLLDKRVNSVQYRTYE